MLNEMRVLRYARAETPYTMTAERRKLVEGLAKSGLVSVVGAGRSGTLMRLTAKGKDRLAVLEKANPDVADYALKQAIGRMNRG